MTRRRASAEPPRPAPGAPPQSPSRSLADFAPHLRAALLAWYDQERRSLPWRGETDPYRVLVSEVMLQQTRVETVRRYYGPWLDRFPDLAALADAEEDAVLKEWEGLGYYRRARNLHRAARVVRDRADGSIPSTYGDLRSLPGVGEYTAGAVASIAFGEPVPAVDGNVRRVLSRLNDVVAPKPAWLREAAGALVDPERPGDWNQALMELGATVCAARLPRCAACPLAEWCEARAAGTQEERPGAAGRASVRSIALALAVLLDSGRVLLERRPADGLLGGLWAFPEREIRVGPRALDAAARGAALALATELGARSLGLLGRLAVYQHRFTHLQATYLPAIVRVDGAGVGGSGLAWVEVGTPISLALPVVQRRMLDDLAERLASGRVSLSEWR